MTESTAEDDFRKWYVDSLAPLRDKGDAGFIFTMVAFPLLERYLRNKSECPEGSDLSPKFFDNIAEIFPDIAVKRREFWQCYRNGLLHQATFPRERWKKRDGIWVMLPSAALSGHDERPVYFDDRVGGFFLNPISFFDHVVAEILANFGTYEEVDSARNRLPVVYDLRTAQAGITPTTGLPLTSETIVAANSAVLFKRLDQSDPNTR